MEPPNKLANYLSVAKNISHNGFLKGSNLDRQNREYLLGAGYLTPILRGWYLLSLPEATGSSTAWYGSFWVFLRLYLSDRFGEDGYHLSAESSIDIHTGETSIAKQVIVRTKKKSNQTIKLLYETSLLLFFDKNFPQKIEKKDGLNILPMPEAITMLSEPYFRNKQQNVEIALKTVSPNDLSRALLQSTSPTDAARVIGALSAIGEDKKSNQIKDDLKAAGILVRPENPFIKPSIFSPTTTIISPYAGRIEALWRTLRPQVIANFPEQQGIPETLEITEKLYIEDAYHSLSIEGYEVTEDLIKKIASGNWDSEKNTQDKNETNVMAAKGYFDAFKEVTKSLEKIRSGSNPGEVFENDLQNWYRALFSASVIAGLLKPKDLAGFRNGPVYIKGSRHIPPPYSAVPDAMNKLFDLIKEENDARVRAILGHFIFSFIHPYVDGNGRIARFLMNLMLVTGGYNWTVIKIEKRSHYMGALERCSRDHQIDDFTKLVFSESFCNKTQILS